TAILDGGGTKARWHAYWRRAHGRRAGAAVRVHAQCPSPEARRQCIEFRRTHGCEPGFHPACHEPGGGQGTARGRPCPHSGHAAGLALSERPAGHVPGLTAAGWFTTRCAKENAHEGLCTTI